MEDQADSRAALSNGHFCVSLAPGLEAVSYVVAVPKASAHGDRPTLLCYDGSDLARPMIEQSAAVLGGRRALVGTVFESMGSSLLRHAPSERTQLGREFNEISEAHPVLVMPPTEASE